jgi:hypothetical protein
MPTSSIRVVWALALVAALAQASFAGLAVPGQTSPKASPCANDPNYRAFDFWIGEWDVQKTGAVRGPIGSGATSIVERQLHGCVIQENWLPPNSAGAGKSFNIYN